MKDTWDNLSAEKQLRYKKIAGISIAVVLGLILYYASGQDEKKIQPEDKVRNLTIGTDMLEDDITTKVNQSLENVGEEVRSANAKIRNLEKLVETLQNVPAPLPETSDDKADEPIPDPPIEDVSENFHSLSDLQLPEARPVYPAPPAVNSVYRIESPPALPVDDLQISEVIKPVVIGGIQSNAGEKVISKKPDTKKKRTVYMPPSFMSAKLLIGLNAMTTDLGEANPEPVVLRVQAPAVLPNNLKANLKGCFVVGNANGNLAQERVNVRLVSLSCMALDGTAVIDQKIQGFVADKDGKRGLHGNVVTKAGAHIMRSMIAAGVGGIGSAVSLSSSTTSVSPLGTTQVFDTEKILQSAAGEGVKGGADAIQELYLEWAKQTGPVIEVGAAKDATVVIQQGVELEIKEKN